MFKSPRFSLFAILFLCFFSSSGAQAQNSDAQTFGNLSAGQSLLHSWNGTTWDRLGSSAAQGGTSIGGSTVGNLRTIGQGYSFGASLWEANKTALGSFTGVGKQAVQSEAGYSSSLNVTAATTVKATVGRIFRVAVVTAGVAGQVCDSATVCAAANVVFTIPAAVGIYDLNWPMLTGIRIEPGAAQVVAVSWN
jgi:hypothetical protein